MTHDCREGNVKIVVITVVIGRFVYLGWDAVCCLFPCVAVRNMDNEARFDRLMELLLLLLLLHRPSASFEVPSRTRKEAEALCLPGRTPCTPAKKTFSSPGHCLHPMQLSLVTNLLVFHHHLLNTRWRSSPHSSPPQPARQTACYPNCQTCASRSPLVRETRTHASLGAQGARHVGAR